MSTGTGLTWMGECGRFLEVCLEACAPGAEGGRGIHRCGQADAGGFVQRESTVVPPQEGITQESVGRGGQGSPCSLGASNLQSLTGPAQQYRDFPSSLTPQGFPCLASLDLPHLPGQQVRLLLWASPFNR